MSVQIAVNAFDPNSPEDKVLVRGNFNDWANVDEMVPNPSDSVKYEKIVNDTLVPVVDTVRYKYFYTSQASGDVWESGSVRFFYALGNEPDQNNNNLPEIVRNDGFFDPIVEPGIFPVYTEILFEIDMRPAHFFLADSGVITFGGGQVTSVDTIYIAGGAPRTSPALAWVWIYPRGMPSVRRYK